MSREIGKYALQASGQYQNCEPIETDSMVSFYVAKLTKSIEIVFEDAVNFPSGKLLLISRLEIPTSSETLLSSLRILLKQSL